VISLADAIESGFVGLSLSLLGTYLYSRRKGAESLDATLHSKIDGCEKTISEQNRLLSKPDTAEEYHRRTARGHFANLSDDAKAVLRLLWTRGAVKIRLDDHGMPLPGEYETYLPGIPRARAELGNLSEHGFVVYRRDRDFTGPFIDWEIAGGYRSSLGDILFQ
jgi:hypothetical protein